MNFKKLTGDLSTSFNRALQFTEEKLGQAERTQYEESFEQLVRSAEASRLTAERIIKSTEAVLQPNPAYRVEDVVCDRLEKERRDRLSPLEDLGSSLAAAAADFPGEYGDTLRAVGQVESRLANLEYEFVRTSSSVLLRPLRQFLETDAKTLQRERKELENYRLDLDAAKAKVKRARESSKPAAEVECQRVQADFDRQLEVTRLLMESVTATRAHHARCLRDFAEAQMQYHAECFHRMQELKQSLPSGN